MNGSTGDLQLQERKTHVSKSYKANNQLKHPSNAGSKSARSVATARDGPISIRVKNNKSEAEAKFKVGMSTKMKKYFKIYATKNKADVSSMHFVIDGQDIQPDDTPAALGLKQNDSIHCIISDSDSKENDPPKQNSNDTIGTATKLSKSAAPLSVSKSAATKSDEKNDAAPCQYSNLITSKINSEVNLASAESAISLLESLPPDGIMPEHVKRIKTILARTLEGGRSEVIDDNGNTYFDEPLKRAITKQYDRRDDHVGNICRDDHLDSVQSTLQDESLKRASIERDDTRDDHFGHVCSAVFDDDYLLSNILYFEGSLAISETSYNLVVGYQHPKPYNTDEPSTNIQHLGTPSNALVCKKWKSFVIGEKGREAWTIIMNEKDDKLINLAKEVVDDESMPWSARLLAMAISDDTASLYRAFDDKEDDSQGIGAAFEEADRDEDDDYEENLRSLEVKYPRGHPFSQCCDAAQQFTYEVTSDCEGTQDDWSALFACNIAYAAAKVGSVRALYILEEFHGPGLWTRWFDDSRSNFIGNLVLYACRFPMLEGPLSSVRHFLDQEPTETESSDIYTLYVEHSGCKGNNLHVAAARGHKRLVEVLLRGGMDPTEYCTHPFPLAADWAEVRGHFDVAKLLRQHHSLVRTQPWRFKMSSQCDCQC